MRSSRRLVARPIAATGCSDRLHVCFHDAIVAAIGLATDRATDRIVYTPLQRSDSLLCARALVCSDACREFHYACRLLIRHDISSYSHYNDSCIVTRTIVSKIYTGDDVGNTHHLQNFIHADRIMGFFFAHARFRAPLGLKLTRLFFGGGGGS